MSEIKKPREFFNSLFGMHDSRNDAENWLPKIEHEDIRCYIEKSAYDKQQAVIAELLAALEFYTKQPHIQYRGAAREAIAKAKRDLET